MQTFVVVLEYSGAALLAGIAANRVPVCEHAYDLETGALAGHPAGDAPRIGFPARQRGWNTPPQTVRCADCDSVVQGAVREIIAAAVAAITGLRRGPGPAAPQQSDGS